MSSLFRSNQYRSIEVVAGPSFGVTLGVVVAAALVQAALGHLVGIRGTFPSLVMIAVVIYAIRADLHRAIVMGALAGLLEDGLSGTGGAWLVATTLVAAGSNGVTRIAFSDGIVQRAAIVALAVVARDAIFRLVLQLQGFPTLPFSAALRTAAVQGALTAIVAAAYLLYRMRYVREQTMVQRR